MKTILTTVLTVFSFVCFSQTETQYKIKNIYSYSRHPHKEPVDKEPYSAIYTLSEDKSEFNVKVFFSNDFKKEYDLRLNYKVVKSNLVDYGGRWVRQYVLQNHNDLYLLHIDENNWEVVISRGFNIDGGELVH